jgi:hypothetical protein
LLRNDDIFAVLSRAALNYANGETRIAPALLSLIIYLWMSPKCDPLNSHAFNLISGTSGWLSS